MDEAALLFFVVIWNSSYLPQKCIDVKAADFFVTEEDS
jgi:hypothetical protein